MKQMSRREKNREEMRQRILGAARQLFVKEGFDNVSMRRISSAIDYSPAAIYRYFKNKREILSTLRDQGFQRFVASQEASAETYADPIERLREGGRGYIRFAREEPDFFQLMFCTNCEEVEFEGRLAEAATRSYELFRTNVAECVATGRFGDVAVDTVAAAMWANVQGLAELISTGRLDFVNERGDLEALIDSVQEFQLRPAVKKK